MMSTLTVRGMQGFRFQERGSPVVIYRPIKKMGGVRIERAHEKKLISSPQMGKLIRIGN